MDETILLANGTLIENAHGLESSGMLFVYILGTEDLRTYFDLFIEPENLTVIHENRYGQEKDYAGYTDLYSITKENGNVNLALRKEVGE